MTQSGAALRRLCRSGKARAAVAGLGLGAAVALSPLAFGQIAPAADPMPAAGAVPLHSFAPLVKRVQPAVVNISVTEKPGSDARSDEPADDLPDEFRGAPFNEFLRRFFEEHRGDGRGGPRNFPGTPHEEGGTRRIALGSGFIIDPSGTVVTNNHVVGEAGKVEVTLQDNSKYTAKLVGRDSRSDLAVLKIAADKPLPFVSFGDSNAAQVGDWVIAVGNPFGLGGSVTTGIISARGRDIHAGQFDDFLQIDAPINRGNSGGPTFNLNGEVIGINTAIYSPNGGSVGIGFAVPSNLAKAVVAQLEAQGKVSRGWLGVQIQEVTPAIAASLGLKGEQGALVAALSPNSPSARAGVKQGDVILAFNGGAIRELRDLPRLVAAAAPGSSATLALWRGGQSIELRTTIGDMPENPRVASASGGAPEDEAGRAEALGLHLATVTNELRRELRIGKDVAGAVVTRVDQGSLADTLGLARGDIVMSIDQHPVQNAQDAAKLLKDAAASPRKSALLLVNRRGATRYIGLVLGRNHG